MQDQAVNKFRSGLNEKRKADTEFQRRSGMSANAKGREAVNKMAKDIKEHNEQTGAKDGAEFQKAGDSFEKARKYAEKIANRSDHR